MTDSKLTSRRGILLGALQLAVGATLVAPDRWRRPLIDTVLLPAHAQTSSSAMSPVFGDGGGPPASVLVSASSETRVPSGGSAVDALSDLTIASCVTAANLNVTCIATADLGGVTVNLGMGSSVSDSNGAFVSTINVPAINIAPVGAIDTISVTCTIAGDSMTSTFDTTQLAAALAGTAVPLVCGV